MTFSGRVGRVVKLLGARDVRLSVFADRATPDSAYAGVEPVVGTIAIDTARCATVFAETADDRATAQIWRARLGIALDDKEVQRLNGVTVVAWIIAGEIRTIGAASCCCVHHQQPMPPPWTFDRLRAQTPLMSKWYGHRYRC